MAHPLPAEIVLHMPGLVSPVLLRPSLRAAVLVERLDAGGFASVLSRLRALDLSTFHAVIRAAATDPQAAEILIAEASRRPLKAFFAAATGPILALIAALIGQEEEPAPKPKAVNRHGIGTLDRRSRGTPVRMWQGGPDPAQLTGAEPDQAHLASAVEAGIRIGS